MNDLIIAFGGNIKAVGENGVTGLLVRYSTKSAPDLAGDYFDSKTDFGFEGSIKTPVYLNHRLPLKTARGGEIVVKKKIGEGTLTMTDEGILIDAILYNRKQYEKALSAMGWSSGSAAHLIDRTRTGKAYHIDQWPLGLDASLTPEPCDPDNLCSVKSFASDRLFDVEGEGEATVIIVSDDTKKSAAPATLPDDKSLAARLNRLLDDLADEGRLRDSVIKSLAREALCDVTEIESILTGSDTRPSDSRLKAIARVLNVSFDQLREVAGAPTRRSIKQQFAETKGMFTDAVEEQTPSMWQLHSVMCDLVRKIATVAQSSAATDTEFDVKAKVTEVLSEYAAAIQPVILSQINDFITSGSEEFYLKSVNDLRESFGHVTSLDLDQHSQMVVSAVRGYSQRMRGNHEGRKSQKAGRVLSQRNRDRMTAAMEQIRTVLDDMEKLLVESAPMATDVEKRAAMTDYLRREWAAQPTGV